MDLLPDSAQQEIVDTTASFLDDVLPIERLRTGDTQASRPDDGLWRQMAELGWFGLTIPESSGGVGLSLVEEVLLLRELGRRVGPLQVLATVVAARVAAEAGDDDRLEALIQGRARAGWAEPLSSWVRRSGVSGEIQIYDGDGVDFWVVVDQDGGFLFDAKPLPYAPHPCVDEFTDLGRAVLEDSLPCVRVASGPGLFQVGALLVAALLSGVGEAARDQSATYAQERKQFGRPIGVYQAIKHPCANMAVRSEAAWSQVAYSALALRAGHADAGFQISAAKHLAGEAALENASANVQVHGGYGFTTEYDAHLLVKRANVLNAVAGPSRFHLQRILEFEPLGEALG